MVNSEYKNYSNAYKVYYNSFDFYASQVYYNSLEGNNVVVDVLLSNYRTEGNLLSNVKELTLGLQFLKAQYVSNKEIKSYLSDENLSSGLEKITLLDELSYNEADETTYYIDQNNVLYYLGENSLGEKAYIKVFKLPTNCEIEVIENFYSNNSDIAS